MAVLTACVTVVLLALASNRGFDEIYKGFAAGVLGYLSNRWMPGK